MNVHDKEQEFRNWQLHMTDKKENKHSTGKDVLGYTAQE